MSAKSEAVKVVVRCRPISSKEIETGKKEVVSVDESRRMITVRNPKPDKSSFLFDAGSQNPLRDFTFDRTYSQVSKQEVIFDETAKPILESVLEGYNGTIFAYGQTGTGKTFTMEGTVLAKGRRVRHPSSEGHRPASHRFHFQTDRWCLQGKAIFGACSVPGAVQ
jgi:hypothetical protein